MRSARWLAAPAALGFAAAVGFGFAAPAASAAPAYGPGATATLTCSATTVALGGTITCTFSGFDAFETVVVTIHSATETLGSFQTDDEGQFTANLTIPTNIGAGTHTLTGTGQTSGHTVSLTLNVVAPTTAAVPPAAPSSLAFTGVDVAEVAGVGAAAIAAGGGLVLVARRRRRDNFA